MVFCGMVASPSTIILVLVLDMGFWRAVGIVVHQLLFTGRTCLGKILAPHRAQMKCGRGEEVQLVKIVGALATVLVREMLRQQNVARKVPLPLLRGRWWWLGGASSL